MAVTSSAGTPGEQPSVAVQEFAVERYGSCGAAQFGLDQAALARLLAQVVTQAGLFDDSDSELRFLDSLRLEELVLARACAYGNERAWELFLNRYRNTLYESAYKIASVESEARLVADSLYAELYGVDAKGQQRTSKLLYYQGRGSLQGWLRVVVAQEYINRYRSTRRETSLECAVEGGAQFAASEQEHAVSDPRVEEAAATELAALDTNERFLLAAYYLDRRTLAEIAKLQGVHESTISRKLERITSNVRKRIRKRLLQSGMTPRQADEAMEDIDVRDLRMKVRETLEQGSSESTFYPKKGESQG